VYAEVGVNWYYVFSRAAYFWGLRHVYYSELCILNRSLLWNGSMLEAHMEWEHGRI
jgi:hypothetical protein